MSSIEAAVEDYLSSLAAERGLSRHTVDAYRRDLTQYQQFLEGQRATSNTTERFVEELSGTGLAPASIARKLAAVRGLHRFMVAEDIASEDPTVSVDTPKIPSRLPKSLDVEEVFALCEAPDLTTTLGRRDRALLEVMYATACRVTEAVDLDLSDVDLEEREALVTGKGDRQRLVPLGGASVAALRSWLPDRLRLRRSDQHALFLNVRGGRLSRQGVWKITRKQAQRAGLAAGSVSPHVLRHSAATHMVEGGADLRVVQEILGHASISTTQVYTRVSPRHLREVYVESHPRSR